MLAAGTVVPDWIIAIIAAGGVGVATGRLARRWSKDRAQKQEDDADLRYSIKGWPATDYAQARPGLSQKVDEVSEAVAEHIESDNANFGDIRRHLGIDP